MIVVVAVGCRPPAPETASAAPGAPFVSMSREVCFGECPIYRIAVYRDGTVRYEGEAYVARRGRYTGTVSEAQIRELDALFTDHRFFGLADAYTHADWTDYPSVKLGYVSPDGRAKVVDHYHGDVSAPLVLAILENGVDRIVGVERWV